MDSYLQLAKTAVEAYVKARKIISPPDKLSPEMKKKAGVFVSIHKKDGSLRGCIGTFLPTTKNIAREIIKNAIQSAVEDGRFPPVDAQELDDLVYSVDILSELKIISHYQKNNPQKNGLMINTPDGRRALLLPDIPVVNTPEEQFQICCLKGGISPDEHVIYRTFTVKRHAEK